MVPAPGNGWEGGGTEQSLCHARPVYLFVHYKLFPNALGSTACMRAQAITHEITESHFLRQNFPLFLYFRKKIPP